MNLESCKCSLNEPFLDLQAIASVGENLAESSSGWHDTGLSGQMLSRNLFKKNLIHLPVQIFQND